MLHALYVGVQWDGFMEYSLWSKLARSITVRERRPKDSLLWRFGVKFNPEVSGSHG
jgi:hypothetical protein